MGRLCLCGESRFPHLVAAWLRCALRGIFLVAARPAKFILAEVLEQMAAGRISCESALSFPLLLRQPGTGNEVFQVHAFEDVLWNPVPRSETVQTRLCRGVNPHLGRHSVFRVGRIEV